MSLKEADKEEDLAEDLEEDRDKLEMKKPNQLNKSNNDQYIVKYIK